MSKRATRRAMRARWSPEKRRVIRRRRVTALSVLTAVVAIAVWAVMAVADSTGGRGGRVSAQHRSQSAAPVSRADAPTANVYSHTLTGMMAPVTRRAKYLAYAPDSQGNGVYVIDARTYKVIRYIDTGSVVQHVVPAWDMRTLYATNDESNSLTPIDPNTGNRAGPNVPVDDPYNMYFTPDGRHAIVVEEAHETLTFRDPHTFAVQKKLNVHCPGVDHMDFSANGTFLIASCEFSGQMVRVNLRTETVSGYLHVGGSPQDVKLSPSGRTFYAANRYLGGVQLIDARTFRLLGFIRTGDDTHGLYISRDTRRLYVTNRAGGSISVIDLATGRIVKVWHVAGTPDMGNVSPDGATLWLASRYTASVLVISTRTGRLIKSIPAGTSPHGLCLWPQPGRYSTGHTGVMR
jgi:DNA-binding beta-propeller fold protein YncE